jgi:hypothetical protein
MDGEETDLLRPEKQSGLPSYDNERNWRKNNRLKSKNIKRRRDPSGQSR